MLPGFLLRGSSPAGLPFPLGDRHPLAERVGVHRVVRCCGGRRTQGKELSGKQMWLLYLKAR